ncbi:uncharacterized protein [Henckelia pumila]|uniref:uncharacterized protein isoform X2 n=1 Tax=Henckelia pumila TaxID=405737 RepID=UPI003C6DBABB
MGQNFQHFGPVVAAYEGEKEDKLLGSEEGITSWLMVVIFNFRASPMMNIISPRACQKTYEDSSQFQPVLHLEMLPKSAVRPKSFEISEPRFQEKYYLWGVFIGKHCQLSNSHLCKEEFGRHMMIHGVGSCKIIETMKSCDARSFLDTLRKGVPLDDKTRSRILDGWELAKPRDDSRQNAECHYRGFVSSDGGDLTSQGTFGEGTRKFFYQDAIRCHHKSKE